jgi:hypothetical protein
MFSLNATMIAAMPASSATMSAVESAPQFKKVRSFYQRFLEGLRARGEKIKAGDRGLKTVREAMNSLSQQLRNTSFGIMEARSKESPSSEWNNLFQALKNIHDFLLKCNRQNEKVNLNLKDPRVFVSKEAIEAKLKEFDRYSKDFLETGNVQSKENLACIIEDVLLLTLELNQKGLGFKLNLLKDMNVNSEFFLKLSQVFSHNKVNPSLSPVVSKPVSPLPPAASPPSLPPAVSIPASPSPASFSSNRFSRAKRKNNNKKRNKKRRGRANRRGRMNRRKRVNRKKSMNRRRNLRRKKIVKKYRKFGRKYRK